MVVHTAEDAASTGTTGDVQEVQIIDLFRTIITNQENMTKRIIKVEKDVQDVYKLLADVASELKNSTSRPPSSLHQTSEPPQTVEFNKIDDEDSLYRFENKFLHEDGYMQKMNDHFAIYSGLFGGLRLIRLE